MALAIGRDTELHRQKRPQDAMSLVDKSDTWYPKLHLKCP